MTNILKLAITVLLFGAIFIVGLNTISDAPTSTAHTETHNISGYPNTTYLNYKNLVAGTINISNATATVNTAAGNYTINEAAGTITTTNPSQMTNYTIYTFAYRSGAQSAVLSTLVITVIGIIIAVLGLLLILREAGIDIKF